MKRDGLVCWFCGRVGTRGFVILSGNGDGTHDTYVCENGKACDRRCSVAAASPTPKDRNPE